MASNTLDHVVKKGQGQRNSHGHEIFRKFWSIKPSETILLDPSSYFKFTHAYCDRFFVLGYQDGMVLLQSVDRSVNQRSKKQAKLPMPTPQWGSNALSSRILIQNHFSLMKVL